MSVIRPATPADVPVILQMIHELAMYEKEPDAVRNTPEMLHSVLFGESPRVFAHMAENEAGQVRGFALYLIKAVLNGRGDQLVDLTRTNLFR